MPRAEPVCSEWVVAASARSVMILALAVGKKGTCAEVVSPLAQTPSPSVVVGKSAMNC